MPRSPDPLPAGPAGVPGVFLRAIGWFIPAGDRDHVDVLRARLFVVLGFLVTANMALFGLLHSLHHYPGADDTNVVVMGVVGAINVSLPFLLRAGVPLRVLAPAFVIMLQLGVAVLAAFDAGMLSGAVFWLVVTPLAAAFLGGARLGWMAVGISVATSTAMFVATTLGYVFPTSLIPEVAPLHHFISFLSCALSVAGLAALYEGPLVQNLRHVSVRLTAANEQLGRELAERVQAQARAEAASRAKDALMANMSHEFRTPLTSILGYADLLIEETDGLHREFLQAIDDGARRLRDTLDAVLDLAWLESAETDLACAPLDVLPVVAEAADAYRADALAKGLALDVYGERRTAHANPDGLRRALGALIDNAVRFTETGRVVVSVWGVDERVVVEVADTGAGIDRSFLPVAAEPFRQASEGDARTHEGTGLGLTVADRLVGMMGGRMTIESMVGRGTTVRLHLPMPAAPSGDSARVLEVAGAPSATARR